MIISTRKIVGNFLENKQLMYDSIQKRNLVCFNNVNIVFQKYTVRFVLS